MFEFIPAIDPLLSYDCRLQRVVLYVEKNYEDVLRLEQAASAAGLEVTYFSKYFRQQIGLSFRDWLAEYRLDKACQLMRKHRFSITQVAAMSGFGDTRNFERATMKYVGCTPSALRADLRPKISPPS